MGATVALDGHVLGNTTNQHRRYVFEVQPALLAPAVAATTIRPMDSQPRSAPAATVTKLAIGSEKATTAV